MSHRRPRVRAFSFVDLCVLMFLLLLIAAACVRGTAAARSGGNRTSCASNLRQIGQAITMYANANALRGGMFPRTVYDGVGGPPVVFTGVNSANPFGPGGPGPNDVTAPLFLLLRAGLVKADNFVCPSSAQESWSPGRQPVGSFSNFPGLTFLSYGCTNPYPTAAARTAGFKWNYTLGSEFAIAADIGPLPPVPAPLPTAPRANMMRANSPNHYGEGQSVLFGDGHVDWFATPYAGAQRPVPNVPKDHIYTYGAPSLTSAGLGPVGPPQDAEDSVILPHSNVAAGAAPLRNPFFTPRRIGVLAVVAIIVAVAAGVWRRPPRGGDAHTGVVPGAG